MKSFRLFVTSSRLVAWTIAALAAVFITGMAVVRTTAFSAKPLRFIVPVGPGSNTDVAARYRDFLDPSK